MAALTLTQKAEIASNTDFQDKIVSILKVKALYWKNFPTPARADVNVALQKRKKLSKSILGGTWAEVMKALVGQYFLVEYTTVNPDLDVNGIPTDAALDSNFDAPYDYFAGVIAGDTTDTEIDW